jgi:ElaB/YqjD/DUF883 family membrane-anchored ribosome-binding protein
VTVRGLVNVLAAAERPWTDIGAVKLLGLVLGALLLLAAIRLVLGRGGRR